MLQENADVNSSSDMCWKFGVSNAAFLTLLQPRSKGGVMKSFYLSVATILQLTG
jgi:hypothetical protein